MVMDTDDSNMVIQQEAVMADPVHSVIGLLDLPPELRNRIYDLALSNGDNKTRVDATWRPTALLSTCRQIRNEALYTAYTTTRFSFTIRNCDASEYIAFRKHIRSLPNKLQAQISYRRSLVDLDWDNLVVWCRHVWKEGWPALPEMNNPGKLWVVLYGATNIAKHTQGTWRECERQLKAFRTVAGKLNGDWLD